MGNANYWLPDRRRSPSPQRRRGPAARGTGKLGTKSSRTAELQKVRDGQKADGALTADLGE